MKIDTLGLQAFVAIAARAHFHKAAAALHISQTALTRRLQHLEAGLGVKLVERTTRSVTLTNIGGNFLPEARRLLSGLETALKEIRESGKAQRGDICIACVPTSGVHFLPRIIRKYSARYPDNRIRILDRLSSAVADAVLSREAEFGVNVEEAHHPELTSTPLFADEFVLVCRDDHPLAKRKKLQWKQLQRFRLIIAGEVSANRFVLNRALGHQALELQSFYEVQRSSTAIGMVAEGIAAAVIPRLAVQKGTYPRIRSIRLVNPVVRRTLVLVSRRSAIFSPAAEELYKLIRKRALAAP
jgi:DNA-binding transcriptional LysR family regulator